MAFHIVLYLLYFLEMIFSVSSQSTEPIKRSFDIEVRHFVYWPNGTIPFYINPNNFDKEQSLAIMLSLSMYSFKTCLKFVPVMADPGMEQHVLVFENPSGVRKCVIGMEGHGKDEPHRVTLGYDCLRSPEIDMIIMKALGFPFEHNRASRDVFVDVQFENIETDHIPLFTKEKILPPELRALPYDADSVMHFGERDFSKNGHRTIIFKNEKTLQKRIGLSATDLRKIAIVYGPECLARERQAKIDICRNYPVVRKKRDVDFATVGNLRVNPDITPPSDVQDQGNLTDDITNNLKELGIEDEVQTLIDQLHKITAAALQSAKLKHCNATDHNVTNTDSEKTPDLVDIISSVDKYARTVVQNALTNLTVFCDDANSMEMYQRGRCQWGLGNRCPVNYRSTMPGAVKYSTQHRPWIRQSTKHEGKGQKYSYAVVLRSINGTDSKNLTRSKRELNATVGATENIIIQTNASVRGDLRMATKILREKTTNYAPVRRNFRENYRDETKDFDVQEKQRKRKLKDPKRFEETRIEKLDEGDERPTQKIKESDQRQKEERYERKDSEVQNKQRKRKLKILNPLGEEIRSEKSDKADERPRQKIMESYRETEERPREKKIIKERKLFRVPQTVTLSKQNREFYAERMWPEGVVNYVIKDEPKYDINKVRDRLSEVNRILRRKTCARLKEITEEEADRVLDYLVLDSSRDYITGRVGGKQNFGSLELFEGGQHRQHAAMMVMGMLGFYFEVSRHDRDKYIRVHNRHIRPDKLHHFEKIRSEATLPLPYDYRSATQPAWQFWRIVGKTGISTVATYKDQDPDGSIMRSLGQNEKLLSDNDLIKINSVYGVKCFQNQRRMKMRYTKSVE